MSIRSRLDRLERSFGDDDGRCPHCPPQTYVRYRQDGLDAEPVLQGGQPSPEPCRRCGRPADVVELVHIIVRTREEAAAALRLPGEEAPQERGNLP